FGGCLLDPDNEVDDGDVGSGHAHRESVELAGEFGNDELDRLGGARRGRNHGKRGGAGAAEILVREVENDLIIRVGVNGGHGASDDFEIVLNHLGDGRETVGGARGIRDDVVLGRIVFAFVDAEDDGDVFVLRRGGDDDFLDRAAQVLFGIVGVGEFAGGFEHDLRAYAFPGQSGGVFFFEDLDRLAVDGDGVGAGGDVVGQVAEDGIVLEKMSESFGIG